MQRDAHLDDELAPLVRDDDAQLAAAVVRMRARDVLSPVAASVHATREAAAVDLRERLDIGGRRCRTIASGEAVEKGPIAMRHRCDVLGTLLAAFDLEARDAGAGDVRQMIRGREILGGDEVAAIEFRAGSDVVEHVILAAGLRARSAIRAALGDHPGHEALAAVRDAERAMNECLEPELGHGGLDGANILECVLAGEHDALDAELPHHACAARVVHGHLRRPVDLETRVDLLNEAHEPDVLHDGRVNALVDCLAKKDEGVG